MAGNDIGVTFIPSEQNQMAQGPKQGTAEGDLGAARSSDLGTAFKILSLQLPRVVSPTAPTSSALLKAPGSAGLPGAPPAAPAMPTLPGLPGMSTPNAAVDPMAAVFAALLRAMQGGSAAPVGGASAAGEIPGGVGAPKVTLPAAPVQEMPAPPSAPPDTGSGAPPPQQDYQSWAGSY